MVIPALVRFQSTLPLRGATFCPLAVFASSTISIHAPLAGSDLLVGAGVALWTLFQSTLPLRGATYIYNLFPVEHYISIHAPLAGSDFVHFNHPPLPNNFNPRSPCGERRVAFYDFAQATDFNPRSPCGERRVDFSLCLKALEFQSTLPLRGATVKQKNTESLRDSTYNFANLIKQVLWSTQNHY